MFLQNGGSKKINPKKTGVTPVRDMINSPGATLEMMTCGSLKGFMFILNVRPDHSEYSGLDGNGTQFRIPITSFIVKLAITSTSEESLPTYVDIKKPQGNLDREIGKATETQVSFFEEAKLQQRIWKTSITGGREEICPPISNLTLFNNADASRFLNFLLYKAHTEGSIHTIRYLIGCCSGNSNSRFGLGMILMPRVERSDTLKEFTGLQTGSIFNDVRVTEDAKHTAYAEVMAKIVRLYIETGVIHFDLHEKNALIHVTSSGVLKAVLIDFGRASDLKTVTDDEYLNDIEKVALIEDARRSSVARQSMREPSASSSSAAASLNPKRKDMDKQGYFDKCEQLCRTGRDNQPAEKVAVIREIMEILAKIDLKKNQRMFGGPDSDYSAERYQMDWLESMLVTTTQNVTRKTKSQMDKFFSIVGLMAFNALCRTIMVNVGNESKVSMTTLNKTCENFDGKTLADFVVPFKTTWGEWGASFGPWISRGRMTGRGKKINNKMKTRKVKKNKSKSKSKSKSKTKNLKHK